MILGGGFLVFKECGGIGSPDQKGNLILHLRGNAHGEAMHVEVVFPQRLPMVGDKEHGGVKFLQLL